MTQSEILSTNAFVHGGHALLLFTLFFPYQFQDEPLTRGLKHDY